MVLRTKNEIRASIKATLATLSPQLRIDANKGPFFYLSTEAVSGPLANASADVERVALLSTLQFPTVATNAEALGLGRAFGLTLGAGGFARGVGYFFTTQRPLGSQVFTVFEGDTAATATSGGQVFEALETRSLTAANADAFYNPATRRYELPVLVQAISAGTAANIAARTLTAINGGASDFDGVTNLTAFRGGTEAQSIDGLYTRTQQRLLGLDNFSRGGLLARVQNVDPERILAASLTYSSEYPHLFFRLPDTQAVDVWILSTTQDTLRTQTFVATAGQAEFVLANTPVIDLQSAQVNGASVAAQLILDESLEVGRSTREQSVVVIDPPAAVNDIVDITYTYDQVLRNVQDSIDGYLQADTGSLFATDVLARYSITLPVVVQVIGTVLGTFDPTQVESEVAAVVGDYLVNGLSDAPAVGGMRNPAELRDAIRGQVPGIASLSIPVFSRKSVAPLVETIDIPRNSQLELEFSTDLTVSFT